MEFRAFLNKHYRQLSAFWHEVIQHQDNLNKQYPMRVVGIDFAENTNEVMVVVDVIGIVKHILPRYHPEELTDDSIICHFPPLQIKMITFLACKKLFEEAIQFKITSYEIIEKETIFTLQSINQEGLLRKSAQEIMYDTELLWKFSKFDIREITFAAAQDQYRLEEDL